MSLRRYRGTFEYLSHDADADNWTTITANDWVGLWAANIPWLTRDTLVAPFAEFDNGFMDVCIIKGASRLDMVRMFLRVSTGKHVENKGSLIVRTKAIRFKNTSGCFSLDGESMPLTNFEARVHPAMARVLCASPHGTPEGVAPIHHGYIALVTLLLGLVWWWVIMMMGSYPAA